MDRSPNEKPFRSATKSLGNATVMAIVDNMQRISDTVWELPPSYKQGMRAGSDYRDGKADAPSG
jgi:hypothetical protein